MGHAAPVAVTDQVHDRPVEVRAGLGDAASQEVPLLEETTERLLCHVLGVLCPQEHGQPHHTGGMSVEESPKVLVHAPAPLDCRSHVPYYA